MSAIMRPAAGMNGTVRVSIIELFARSLLMNLVFT